MYQQLVIVNSIIDFAGRMHPVLVHLPIGILLLVCLFYIFASSERRQSQYNFIEVALLCGMLTAIAACVSGLLLANSGDYEEDATLAHKWMGIATAITAIVCYWMHRRQVRFIRVVMILLAICITVAGHLGGTITHGADFLTEPLRAAETATKAKPIPNVQQAVVYNDIIQPILSAKCYSCHGSSKQKGKLRLDQPAFILKGGKDGAAIDWNHADKSVLIERILLPVGDDDHMPPKEKPQLSRQEIDLLQWWVTSGAGFDKKVMESKVTDKIKPVLKALQEGSSPQDVEQALIPDKDASPANEAAISALRETGAVVIPVATGTNYLFVNFVSAEQVTPEALKLLEQLKEQLIWLKIDYKNLKDDDLKAIGNLQNLTKLYLQGNPITDVGLEHLKNLQQLQYLNLSGTSISTSGLQRLAGLKKLEKLHLYKVNGGRFDLVALKKLLPKTMIDTGGYLVPTLQTDTTIFNGAADM